MPRCWKWPTPTSSTPLPPKASRSKRKGDEKGGGGTPGLTEWRVGEYEDSLTLLMTSIVPMGHTWLHVCVVLIACPSHGLGTGGWDSSITPAFASPQSTHEL
jgi:hypothetical protein